MGNIEKSWSRLDLQTVFHTPIFELWKEKSKSSRTGVEQDFFYLNCMDWVTVIAITPNDEIVMIRQYRHGSKQVEIEIPGGCIDVRGADPVSEGARELFEETGYRGTDGVIIGQVSPNPAMQGNLCYTVYFRNCVKVSEPQMEETETIETMLMPVSGINKLVRNGTIRHGLVLNALAFFDHFTRFPS